MPEPVVKLTQKRVCGACAAHKFIGGDWCCLLHYPIRVDELRGGIPLAPCPKPKNHWEVCRLS